MAFTGRGTFMAVSSWVWVLGLVGDTATAGAGIASAMAAAEVIAAVAEPWRTAAVMRMAAELRTAALAQPTLVHRLIMLEPLVPVQAMQQRTTAAHPQPRIAVAVRMVLVVHPIAAVAAVEHPTAVEVEVVAGVRVADIGNLLLQSLMKQNRRFCIGSTLWQFASCAHQCRHVPGDPVLMITAIREIWFRDTLSLVLPYIAKKVGLSGSAFFGWCHFE